MSEATSDQEQQARKRALSKLNRETLQLEDGRNLYLYTTAEMKPSSELPNV